MALKPVVLIIRDGWGSEPHGLDQAQRIGNAPLLASTPFHDELEDTAPQCFLSASGLDVGLPEGQMGNSEVGHLNLGAGRIVYQDFTRINKAIADGELASNPALTEACKQAQNPATLHLIGLVSDGGVHSHLDHLVALIEAAKSHGVERIAVHAITDGRDTSPQGGAEYLHRLEERITPHGARIVTVIGRYFAMDRDNRWERTQKAWDAIVHGKGQAHQVLASEAVAEAYSEDTTDEFMEPMRFDTQELNEQIVDGDVVLLFNFRSDRGRQLSQAFLFDEFEGFERGQRPQVHYLTMTQYDAQFPCPVLFGPNTLENTLGDVVSAAGLKQLRIAETEKYPHVTYFFNGGNEQVLEGELREIIPSPKVATYDLQPEMSAEQVTETVLDRLPEVDLVILNFANPDMVGHTGDLKAAITACEVIDECVQLVAEKTLELGGSLLITADHGNCEQMIAPDGQPHTAHTTNLVHCWYLGKDKLSVTLKDGILADVAPTLLDMLQISAPEQMTGQSLIVRTSV